MISPGNVGRSFCGLWGGLGMKEFCCFGSCCHGFCEQVGAQGILMQKMSNPLGLGVNWLMALRNEVLNLAHKNSSCVGPCHWLPLRINPFLRTLTLGFCWCSVLVCKYSFTKSHSSALCPQCLPAAFTVLMGWQWVTCFIIRWGVPGLNFAWLEMCQYHDNHKVAAVLPPLFIFLFETHSTCFIITWAHYERKNSFSI